MRTTLSTVVPVVAVVVALALLAVAVALFLAPRDRDAAPGSVPTPLPSWAPPAAAPPKRRCVPAPTPEPPSVPFAPWMVSTYFPSPSSASQPLLLAQ